MSRADFRLDDWPSTEFTVFAEYQEEESQLDPGIPVLPGGRIPDVPFSRYYGERFATLKTPVYQLRYVFDHELSSAWSFHSRGGVQHSDDKQGKIDFEDFEADGRALTRRFRRQTNDHERFSLINEAVGKLNTGTVHHTVLAGVEYSEDHQFETNDAFELAPIDVFNPVYAGTFGPSVESFDFDERLDALGLYLQDQIKFSERWTLVAGGRFDRYERIDKSSNLAEVKTEDTNFSPRIGIVYQPRENLALYANYAESFRPQLGLQQSGSPVNAETGQQFEIGVKAELFQNQLSATLAVFHITKDNVLARDPENAAFVIQTGEQRSRGVELDIAGRISPGGT